MPWDSRWQDLGKCLTSLCCTKTSLGSFSSNSEMVVETEDRNSGFNIHILKAQPIGFTEEPKLWHEKTQGGDQWFCSEPYGKMEFQLTELEQVWRNSSVPGMLNYSTRGSQSVVWGPLWLPKALSGFFGQNYLISTVTRADNRSLLKTHQPLPWTGTNITL